MACDDRQLSEAQRQAGYQNQRTGVQQAVRPFSGRPTLDNLIDYINRELQPAVRAVRNKVNDVYLPVVDNAPSGNPLGFYFSTETGNADPTTGRIRLDQATQDTATTIRVSETNRQLADVLPWLDVMSGGATSPLGVVTLTDAVDPRRFIRFDLNTMTDAGAYWNLGVTPIESSHDNPFIDGGPVTIGFIPGVGGTTAATVPASSISGADGPRQFLSTSTGTAVDFRTLSAIFPGAPIYDVMAYPFNAAGNGTTDDTTALNAAIAAANASAGVIYLGPAHRITAALTTITRNNVVIKGRGRFNGGSEILIDAAAATDFITFDTCQYVGISDVRIRGVGALYTTGAAVKFYGTFQGFAKRLLITQLANGIDVQASVITNIIECTISDLYGTYGIWFHGDDPFYSHALQVEHCLLSTNFPNSVVGFTRDWQTATAYVIGNSVTHNGNIYQAVSNGTSGATGPSGIPGATVATAHTATVTDGTVSWVLAMPQTQWYLFDSFAHTLRLIDSGALQGGYGIRMIDTSGGTDGPQFLRVVNTELDHVGLAGISLEGGGQAEFEQTFVTSMLNGPAIQILDTFDGVWRFNGGVLFASGVELMTIAAPYGVLSNFIIAGGGLFTSNTYDAIRVDANTTDFSILDCQIGASSGAAFPATRYGISIAAGCDEYIVQGNRILTHQTGAILNTPGVSSTRLVRNNVPDVNLTEIEETGAGPFNDYDTQGARHIMASNAAGVFTGVANVGVTGDIVIFSHQGTGYTEFQHNTGSAIDNVFITGRIGKNLRIYDNEIAVFQWIDTVSGSGTFRRWELMYPYFPFATASDSALGDVVAHDGSHYAVISGGGDASVVLRGDATFGAPPAAAIAEVEETGAGPFNDYAPTGNARHILCSNAAGVFTGVSATGYVVGDVIVFSHQGTGFTELRHNTGSSASNVFFTGRQGKNLRIFDNEVAVFRYLDTVSGGTTTRRWVLAGPQFPYAQADDDATGDIVAFNGTNYQRIVGGASADVVLRGNATFGTVSTAAIANDAVTDAKLRNSGALSVIGRSANSTGDPADISGTASSDAVLRVSGTTLGFGTVATAGIADDAVTNPKLANMAQATIKGRASGAGTGDPTDLTASQARAIIGSLLAVTTYDSGASGTHNFNADTKSIIVRMWGGGSGGYGVAAASAAEIIAGSGGAGGDYLEVYAALAGATSMTYDVGAGGSAGTGAAPSSPGSGGDTEAVLSGATARAGGGSSTSGSAMASGTTVALSTGQVSIGGNAGTGITSTPWVILTQQKGIEGELGFRVSGTVAYSGKGGSSGAGGNGGTRRLSGGAGNSGSRGCGGSGGMSVGGTLQAGGVGFSGFMVVYEFT
jgi:hypothetical protein